MMGEMYLKMKLPRQNHGGIFTKCGVEEMIVPNSTRTNLLR